jgi:predicted transcriptional regulator
LKNRHKRIRIIQLSVIMANTNQNPSEDRDQQILRRLANIEHKIDSIEQTTAFTLRAEADRHFETVKLIFGNKKRCVQVYLAANGARSVNKIAELLDMQPPNVSRELKYLQKEGLLEISEHIGGENYWNKKPIDQTIRISYHLQSKFKLNKDGLPS